MNFKESSGSLCLLFDFLVSGTDRQKKIKKKKREREISRELFWLVSSCNKVEYQ